jgi:hypothetical protein
MVSEISILSLATLYCPNESRNPYMAHLVPSDRLGFGTAHSLLRDDSGHRASGAGDQGWQPLAGEFQRRQCLEQPQC